MRSFVHDNWMISNNTGLHLFHEVASGLPIIDYHNHLNSEHIAENKRFENLTQLWIADDPYKHRAMRINGIPERGITGDVTDFEKFMYWVDTLPRTVGNPLFHWSCLELKRVFGIEEVLSKDNAKGVWDTCNSMLRQKGFRAREIAERWKAEILVTSDHPLDGLKSHSVINMAQEGLRVLPSLRADAAVAVANDDFKTFVNILSREAGGSIADLRDFTTCIKARLDFFAENGCLFADHALDSGFSFIPTCERQASELFASLLGGKPLLSADYVRLRSFLLAFLGESYAALGWTMQLHIGAHRKTSSRLKKLAGAAGGFACIGKACDMHSLTLFLDSMEKNDALPDVVLHTLNPSDNAAFASLTGSYAQDGVAGKIQFGPAWWYNDHYEGIRQHLRDISSIGLLSTFIGMTTDSRSLLSLSRHEYFRRILCDLVGGWAERGMIPKDLPLLQQLIKDISYFNIKDRIQKMEKAWQI